MKGGPTGEESSPPCPPSLFPLLTIYEHVFHMPSGLPPIRNHEHSINLKHGTDLISVISYKYPQMQKDEIENLTKDMLFVFFDDILIPSATMQQHVGHMERSFGAIGRTPTLCK